jgi:hypothetical protein
MKLRAGTYFWVTLLAGILLIGIACTKPADDSQITSQTQSKLNEDSGLQGKPITVQTSGGVVTLSGTVDNEAERTAASRYASGIPGVKQVVNNLQVSQAAPVPEQAAEAAPAARHKPSPARHRTSRNTAMDEEEAAPVADNTLAQAPEPAPAPPPPPPAPKKVTIPAGTTLAVRLVDSIDSEKAQPGQSFRATLDSPLSSEGDVVLPAGYDVHGHIVDVKSAGKFAGKSELVLQLDRITVGNKSYSVQTDQYRRQGNSRTTNTAEKVGVGAAIGAIIGGLAGGGKGAGIGAAAGGGLGGGVQAATKGQQIKLPSETVLNFTLQSPLTVTQEEGPDANRRKLENPQ